MAGLGPPERDIGAARAPRWSGRALLVLFGLALLVLALIDRLGIQGIPAPRAVAGAALALFAATAILSPARRPTDYYVADRELAPAQGGLAVAAGFAGLVVAGLAGGNVQGGLGIVVTAAGLLAGLALLGLFVAPRLRRFGGYTVGDFLAARFGQRVRLAWAGVAFAASLLLLLAILTIVGPLVSAFLGLRPKTGLFIAAAATVIAVLPGGLRSLVAVQSFQYFLVAFACITAAAHLTFRSPADPLAFLAAPDIILLPGIPAGTAMIASAAVPLMLIAGGAVALPQMLTTAASAQSGRTAGASYAWGIVLAVALIAMGLVFGRTALIVAGSPEVLAAVEFVAADGPLLSALPPVLVGLVLAGILAALLAAGQASLFAAASALSHEVWDETLDRRGPAGRRIFIARLFVVAIGVAAAAMIRRYPADAPALLGWALALSAAGGFMPIVLGLWWRGCSALGALCGMLTGLSIAVAALLIDLGVFWSGAAGFGIGSMRAAMFGTAAALGIAVAVSIVVPARREADDDIMDTLRGRRDSPLRERSA